MTANVGDALNASTEKRFHFLQTKLPHVTAQNQLSGSRCGLLPPDTSSTYLTHLIRVSFQRYMGARASTWRSQSTQLELFIKIKEKKKDWFGADDDGGMCGWQWETKGGRSLSCRVFIREGPPGFGTAHVTYYFGRCRISAWIRKLPTTRRSKCPLLVYEHHIHLHIEIRFMEGETFLPMNFFMVMFLDRQVKWHIQHP